MLCYVWDFNTSEDKKGQDEKIYQQISLGSGLLMELIKNGMFGDVLEHKGTYLGKT